MRAVARARSVTSELVRDVARRTSMQAEAAREEAKVVRVRGANR